MSAIDPFAVWLGHPGSLVALPDPSPDVEVIRSREVAIHVGVAGGRSVDVTGSGLRTFKYSYSRLTSCEAEVIDAFHAGDHGPGPYALIDPVYPNRLTANQASGGTVCGDTSGFSVEEYGAIEVDHRISYTGPSSILWAFNPASLRVLALPSPRPSLPDGTRAFPVLPGVPVRLGAWVRPETATWCGWVPRFYDASGQLVSSATPDPEAVGGETWRQITAHITPPNGAVWIAPRLAATTVAPRVCDPARVNVDSLEMTYGTALADKARTGAGVPQVEFTAWSQTIPHLGHVDAQLELTEVCA
ncbi:MAG: hypothetical protein ACRD0P_02875 [Stackebrandtia sp.]